MTLTPQDVSRIFIVDDHPVFRYGLNLLIESDTRFEMCGEAEDTLSAMDRLRASPADLVIVDVSLKEGPSGVELVKQIRIEFPDVRILVMSMHDEAVYAERALRAGAHGYLMKDVDSESIITVICKILDGQLVFSDDVTQKVLSRQMLGRNPSGSRLDILSDRELEIFELIGRGKGTREIGEMLNISVKTVETHRGRIKNKLGINKGNELIRMAAIWCNEH
jgi:DNA-binding NarL/FixJ family response regulator